MNFFERQDAARRQTGLLVLLFGLAMASIIASVYVIVTAAIVSQYKQFGFWQPELLLAVIGVTVTVIALGSLYKIAQLRGGGSYVAESLGGKLVPPDSADPVERKILNIVEEMAIASGAPVPSVYVLPDEKSINAFAAGYSINDAVVGVTRGCVEMLTRDELQGVVAHEFSHIFNGDMRLNIRLIGILNGILIIGMIGYYLMRTMFFTGGGRGRRGKDGGGMPMIAVGLGLMAVGFMGTLFGNMIKAAVSRQREFLADASAVQFTRDPAAVAGALKKIGAVGATVRNPAAVEISHMFFARAITSGINSAFATHPALEDRIRRIDPGWDGSYPEVTAPAIEQPRKAAVRPGIDIGELVTGTAILGGALARVGQPTPAHVEYASELIRGIPSPVIAAAREPYGARAVIYALLINREAEARQKQLERVRAHADEGVRELTRKLLEPIEELDERARLPLVDLATPALRELSPTQYATFRENVTALVEADEQLELFEWVLQRMILRHLEPNFSEKRQVPVQYYNLARLRGPVGLLLSALAHGGHEDPAEAREAFGQGSARLELDGLGLLDRGDCRFRELDAALDVLDTVTFKLKQRLLEAGAATILADRRVTTHEAELLRGVADSLGCPMPPLLPGPVISGASLAG